MYFLPLRYFLPRFHQEKIFTQAILGGGVDDWGFSEKPKKGGRRNGGADSVSDRPAIGRRCQLAPPLVVASIQDGRHPHDASENEKERTGERGRDREKKKKERKIGRGGREWEMGFNVQRCRCQRGMRHALMVPLVRYTHTHTHPYTLMYMFYISLSVSLSSTYLSASS